jgi:hypothetical protein
MGFKKQERHAYEDTHRKRLAALRWQRRERERFPLLAAEIAEHQPGIDSIMAARIGLWIEQSKATRTRRAEQWRTARRRIAGMDADSRAAVLAYWNGHRWLPGDPTYLLDMLHMIDRERLIRDGMTYRPARTFIEVREAIDAAVIRTPAHSLPMIPGLWNK